MNIPEAIDWKFGRLALLSDGEWLSYQDLNIVTDELAAHILEILGPGPEPVTVFADFGRWFTITAIAIWKAGKISVQVAKEQSDERIKAQLKRIPTRLVLTTQSDINALLKHDAPPSSLFNLDRMTGWLFVGGQKRGSWNPEISFFEFTSGSTGMPKVVAHTHQTEINLAKTNAGDLQVSQDSRVAHMRGGISGYQNMALALLSGAALVVRPADVAKYADWINTNKISVLPMLASSYRYLMSSNATFPSVKVVEVGGEMVDYGDLDLFREAFSDTCLFINRYSTSETRVIARGTYNRHSPKMQGRLPVGWPIDGVLVKIVNEKQNEVPWAGMIGEIAVLTPYLHQNASGWYMTGDLGYIGHDGIIFHCGRKDFQEVRAKFDPPELSDGEKLDRVINTTLGSL